MKCMVCGLILKSDTGNEQLRFLGRMDMLVDIDMGVSEF